jgi:hypothetical protein
MRTSLGSLLLLAALALQPACSSTSSSAADVTGSWTGTYADTKSGVTGPLAASFSEQNGSLGGTLTISSGWLCSVASEGNVSGNVDGTQVQASATFGDSRGPFVHGERQRQHDQRHLSDHEWRLRWRDRFVLLVALSTAPSR